MEIAATIIGLLLTFIAALLVVIWRDMRAGVRNLRKDLNALSVVTLANIDTMLNLVATLHPTETLAIEEARSEILRRYTMAIKPNGQAQTQAT